MRNVIIEVLRRRGQSPIELQFTTCSPTMRRVKTVNATTPCASAASPNWIWSSLRASSARVLSFPSRVTLRTPRWLCATRAVASKRFCKYMLHDGGCETTVHSTMLYPDWSRSGQKIYALRAAHLWPIEFGEVRRWNEVLHRVVDKCTRACTVSAWSQTCTLYCVHGTVRIGTKFLWNAKPIYPLYAWLQPIA